MTTDDVTKDLEKCQEVLTQLFGKYKALDNEFIDMCEKAGVHAATAFMALATVHKEVGEGMERMLLTLMSGKIDALLADDEEE